MARILDQLPKVHLIPLVLLLATAAGCKTVGPQSSQAEATTATADAPACAKPPTVNFAPAPGDTVKTDRANILPQDASVNLGLGNIVNISVNPSDFANLQSNECRSDGTCTAILNKPIKLGVNVPVGLMSKIAVNYEQAKGDQPGICLRKVQIGGSIGGPVCLGKILNFGVNVGMGVTQSKDSETNRAKFNAEPYLNANFNANLPFLSVGAKLDGNGLTFSSKASASTMATGGLYKVGAAMPVTHSYTLPFPKWPESLRTIKSYFASKGNGSADGAAIGLIDAAQPDIRWDDVAVTCPITEG